MINTMKMLLLAVLMIAGLGASCQSEKQSRNVCYCEVAEGKFYISKSSIIYIAGNMVIFGDGYCYSFPKVITDYMISQQENEDISMFVIEVLRDKQNKITKATVNLVF